MYRSRWWHVAVLTVSAVGAALLLTGTDPGWRQLVSGAALAVLVLGWFTVGRHGFDNPRIALGFSAFLAVIVPVAVLGHPSLAVLQTVSLPLLWVFARGIRDAVGWNVATTVLIALAFWVSIGGTAGLLQGVFAESLSLAFSLAIGFWIAGIEGRSEERQQLIDQLRTAQEQVAVLSRDAGITSERERMARELHDTIAQSLTAIVMVVQRARSDAASGDTAGVIDRLDVLEESARDALVETRALVAAGSSVSVDAGLVAALSRLAERFGRETGIRVTVDADRAPQLSRDREVVLLRCAQESLANVRKHAHARTVRLVLAESAGRARLSVIDDGRGFESAPTDGFGIAGMRERLSLVDGSLDVASSPGGTRVEATIPLVAS